MMSIVCDREEVAAASPYLTGWGTNYRPDPATTASLTLVFLVGFAGAGKTTLANKLHQSLHWEVLSKDLIQWQYMRALNLSRPLEHAEKEKTGRDAFETLFNLIEDRIVSQEKSIIIDTCGYLPFILQRVQAIQAKSAFHVSLKVILCNADSETRKKRLEERGSMFEPFYYGLPEIVDDSQATVLFQHLPKDRACLDTTVPREMYDLRVGQAALAYVEATSYQPTRLHC